MRVGIWIKSVALFCLLVVFTGCGKQDDNRMKVAVVPMGTTHEFWKAIHAGAETAGRQCDVEIIWKGPLKEDDREEQIQIVETLIAGGIDALVLSPLDDRALVRPVMEARRAGIPTVVFNSALTGEEHVSFVATDNYRGGVLAAETLGTMMNGRGNLIQVLYQEGVEGTTSREEGFRDTMRELYPGITILSDNQYTGVTTESAYRTCENLLTRFPDVDAVFTPNESTTFGCLRALQDRELAGKVLFIGFDASDKLIEAMEHGEIHGLVIQNPFQMGYWGVKNAVAHLRDAPYDERVDTGVYLATPDNMHDAEVEKLLRPDLSILGE